MESMAKWINAEHGKGTTDLLLQLKKIPLRLDKAELYDLSKHYLKLFNEEIKGVELKIRGKEINNCGTI